MKALRQIKILNELLLLAHPGYACSTDEAADGAADGWGNLN